jgi:hypothetical protein
MGFFDTVKQKAGVIAGDAERAARVTAAQARLVVLQNDVRKAERDLGQAAYELIDRGGLAPAGLEEAVARLSAALGEISDKEAEIARLRGTHAADEAPAEAGTTTDAGPEVAGEAPAEAPVEAAAETAGEAPREAEEVAPAVPEVVATEGDQTVVETPAKKPAAKATGARRAPAKKTSAKTAPGKRPAAKKAPATAGKAAVAKPGAKKTTKQGGGKE